MDTSILRQRHFLAQKVTPASKWGEPILGLLCATMCELCASSLLARGAAKVGHLRPVAGDAQLDGDRAAYRPHGRPI